MIPTGMMRDEIRPPEILDRAFLESTVQQATLLVRARGSGFYLRDAAGGDLSLAAAYNLADRPCDPELLNRVCRSRQTAIGNRQGQGDVLAVPSVWRDSVQGVLVVVAEPRERAFDEQDALVLRPLADLAVAVLRQTARLARMTAQFRALHVIDVAHTSSVQLDRLLSLILDKAVTLVGAEHGSLRLLNPETGELVLKAYTGEGWTPEVRAYTFPIGHGITGWVAQHRRPYRCPDAHHDPQNVVLFGEMRSSVAVPLLVSAADRPAELTAEPGESEELLGVLLLECTRPAAFDPHDVELLEALAQEAVIAIRNATQQQKLQAMHQTLQDEQERRVAAEKWTVMGQAATALAHRINNLMGIVPACADEIRRALAGLEVPEADRSWIEANLTRIERNGRFILRLADALFRPFQEHGPQARFDINLLLNEALQAACLPPGIQVMCHYSQGLPQVESNSLLVDIFVELITNARKAMEGESQRRLELRTRLQQDDGGPWVVVDISDTGKGIGPEQMAHLWNMFQQSTDGLGFGLWWVRTFIEQQGGAIGCDSRPGAGTTFSVRLPAHPSAGLTA